MNHIHRITTERDEVNRALACKASSPSWNAQCA